MQYLLQDLIKLPLSERISVVESVINSIGKSDYEAQLITILKEKVKQQEQLLNTQ